MFSATSSSDRTIFSLGSLSLVWGLCQNWAWCTPSDATSKRSLWCKLQQALETAGHRISCVTQAPTCLFTQSGWLQGRAKHAPTLQALSPACSTTAGSNIDREHGSYGPQDHWHGDASSPSQLTVWGNMTCAAQLFLLSSAVLCAPAPPSKKHTRARVFAERLLLSLPSLARSNPLGCVQFTWICTGSCSLCSDCNSGLGCDNCLDISLV